MNKNAVLVLGEFTEEPVIQNIEDHIRNKDDIHLEVINLSQMKTVSGDIIYLLYLTDYEIKKLFENEISTDMKMGVLPSEHSPNANRAYNISDDPFQTIDDIFNTSETTGVDMLRCNGALVLGNIIIGNVHGMNRTCKKTTSYYTKIKSFVSDLRHLTFQSYTLVSAKGNITTTAATGIMVFNHNISGTSRNLLNEELSHHGSRVHALILAPSSIISYLYYLFISYFLGRLFINNLPDSIGVIISSKLEVTSPEPIKYSVDGDTYNETMLCIEIDKEARQLYLRENLSDKHPTSVTEEIKETIRVHGLPTSQMSSILINEPVPFLPKADEEDFKELFVSLRQSSKITSVFIVLMILSTLLATTGLFQNSTPVIIGAMVLAPLMSPIVSFSMGVLRGEKELLKESTTTLFIGIVTALAFSCIYTYFMPLNVLTDEMRSRLNPNVLDLMVAIISGIAGAYAHAKSEVAKSLAGVAIAVALVPPLSVTGIGIGWWDSEIVYGSFLLFLTNLAGITLSAALTFLLLGFSPVHRAKKGIVFTSLFLVLITVPLIFSFVKVIDQNKIFLQLKKMDHATVDDQIIRIRVLSIDLSKDKPVVYIETRSTKTLNNEQLHEIKKQIDNTLKRKVTINMLSEIEIN